MKKPTKPALRPAGEQLRAAYYGRVSTAEQVDGTSLATQRERCEMSVEQHGWQLVDAFVDEGISGAKGSRPQLDRLMAACRTGDVEAVVVAKLDRFGRSVRHLSRLLGELDDLGVVFVSVAESFDSSTPAGRLQRNMLGSFAEFERDQIRERTSGGLAAVARDGYWPGGPPPLGFDLQKDGRHSRLVIDEVEAGMIRKAVSLLLDEGQTTWQAAATLNALGQFPRGKGRKLAPGEPREPSTSRWTHINLRRMLQDARINGKWDYGRSDVGSRSSNRGEFEVEIPAIISQTRWDQLQVVLASTTTGPRTPDRFYLLSGGMLRSVCGAKMYGVFRKDRGTRQYFCNNSRVELRNRNGAEGGERCGCKHVHAEVVEPLVWAEVTRLLADPAQLMSLAAEYLATRSDQMVDERDDAADVDRQVARLEVARTERAKAALLAGVDPQLIASVVAEIDDELAVLRRRARQLASLRKQTAAATDGIQRVIELAEQAHERLGTLTLEEQRVVLDALDVKVRVLGWEPCETCAGRGKLRGGSGGVPCPTCRMSKAVPRIRIEGTWTTALLDAYGQDVREQSGEGVRRPGPRRRSPAGSRSAWRRGPVGRR